MYLLVVLEHILLLWFNFHEPGRDRFVNKSSITTVTERVPVSD